MKTWLFILFAVMCSVPAASVPASAETKEFDLYSWQQAGTVNYCYAILPSSKEAPAVSAIKAAHDQVCGGGDDFKRIVLQSAPEKSRLKWKVDPANGLVLPTRGIVNDFKRFCKTIPYKLDVAEPK